MVKGIHSRLQQLEALKTSSQKFQCGELVNEYYHSHGIKMSCFLCKNELSADRRKRKLHGEGKSKAIKTKLEVWAK